MRNVCRITIALFLLFSVACSQAIPTVTTLTAPSGQDNSKETSVDSGGGFTSSTNNFKIRGKIGGSETTVASPNYRISLSGDN